MADPFVIPQNSQPILDARGIVTRPWYLFFQAVFRRIGGANGTGNAVFDAAISDLQTMMQLQPDSTAAVSQLRQDFTAFTVAQAAIDAAQTARIEDLEILGAFA